MCILTYSLFYMNVLWLSCTYKLVVRTCDGGDDHRGTNITKIPPPFFLLHTYHTPHTVLATSFTFSVIGIHSRAATPCGLSPQVDCASV